MRFPQMIVNSKTVFLVMLVVMLISNMTFSKAQDESLTATPSETPTEVPGVTATALPTETAVTTATLTPLLPEETESVNPSLTPEGATLTPLPLSTATAFPAEPPLSAYFVNNFDAGDLTAWTLGAGWGLVASETGQAVQVIDSDQPAQLQSLNLFNSVTQLRFRSMTGSLRLIIRQSNAGDYTVIVTPAGQVQLYRQDSLWQTATIPASQPEQWRTLRVSAINGMLRVAVDGLELIAIHDDAVLPSGSLSLSALFPALPEGTEPDQNSLWVDDVAVGIPTAEMPIATAVVTETEAILSPTVTETASPSVTSEAFPPEPLLTPIFTENFDGGPSILWTLGAGWSYVPNENGLALQGTLDNESVIFSNSMIMDAAVEARFQINTGSASISTRVSEAGSYRASLDINGEVNLYRNQVLLGSTIIAPLVVGEWYTLHLSTFGDIIRVGVDGNQVIIVRDAEALPPGTLVFQAWGISNATSLSIDDMRLSIAGSFAESTETPEELAPLELPRPLPNNSVAFRSSFGTLSQNESPNIYEIHNINTVQGFLTTISIANSNPADIYVLFMQPGIYTIPSAQYEGLEITGHVVIVGNLGASVNNPYTPENQKVIFQPISLNSVFSPNNINPNYLHDGTLILHNVVIQGNGNPTGSGGAIYNLGTLKIYNSLLRNNRATKWGGAIYNGGSYLVSAEVVNTVFENNSTTVNYPNTGGGAVASQYGATFSAMCSSFISNSTISWGGAIFVFNTSGSVTLGNDANIYNNFEGNVASRGYGGIYNPGYPPGGSIPPVNATGQYWNPAASTTQNQPNSSLNTFISSPATLPGTLNCEVPAIPKFSNIIPASDMGLDILLPPPHMSPELLLAASSLFDGDESSSDIANVLLPMTLIPGTCTNDEVDRPICSAYAYTAFYYLFTQYTNRPPTVWDILSTVYYKELHGFQESGIALEALSRGFFDSQAGACRFDKIIIQYDCSYENLYEWLGTVHSLYDKVVPNGAIVNIDLLFILAPGQSPGAALDFGEFRFAAGLPLGIHNTSATGGIFAYDGFINVNLPINLDVWRTGQGPDVPSKWGNQIVNPPGTNNLTDFTSYNPTEHKLFAFTHKFSQKPQVVEIHPNTNNYTNDPQIICTHIAVITTNDGGINPRNTCPN